MLFRETTSRNGARGVADHVRSGYTANTSTAQLDTRSVHDRVGSQSRSQGAWARRIAVLGVLAAGSVQLSPLSQRKVSQQRSAMRAASRVSHSPIRAVGLPERKAEHQPEHQQDPPVP